MATAGRKTDEVLASARRDLQAQLAVVRDELTRLGAEERALTRALASLDGDSTAEASTSHSKPGSRSANSQSASRKGTSRRRRRRRAASKSTGERVEELRALLADGPKSRGELAAALDLSPPRVQQLLAELGGAVSSRPDPEQGRSRLWSLKSGGNGGRAAKPAPNRAASKGKRTMPAARASNGAKGK